MWPVTVTIQPGLSPKVADLPPPQVACCARDTMENKDGPFMRKIVTDCKLGLEKKNQEQNGSFLSAEAQFSGYLYFKDIKILVLIFELKNDFFISQKYVNIPRMLEVSGVRIHSGTAA